MSRQCIYLVAALLGFTLIATLQADDTAPAFSYAAENPTEAVVETIPGLIIWAEAELAEHQGEGLYKERAIDETNTQTMINIAKELEAKGKLLLAHGETDKALPQFLAAEAVARYAATMPHLLENRVFGDEHDEEAEHH